MDAQTALDGIVQDEKGSEDNKATVNDISIAAVDRYIVEIIRVSKMYKFELRVRPKAGKQAMPEKDAQAAGIESHVGKTVKEDNEEKPETNHYIAIMEEFKDENIAYADSRISVKHKEHKYDAEKINTRYQELWEKTGFYQEKTMIAKVKVQLWPEHNFYDHFKRKKAFLFC